MTFTGDVTNVISKINVFLTDLEEGINDKIFSKTDLPVIGDKLNEGTSQVSKFIGDIKTKLGEATVNDVESLRTALYNALNDLGYLQDLNGDNTVSIDDVIVNELSDNVDFEVKFKSADTLTTGFSLGEDLPGLALNVEGDVNTNFGIEYDLKFAVNQSGDVYIDTAPTDELQITLDNSIALDSAEGKLGLQEV